MAPMVNPYREGQLIWAQSARFTHKWPDRYLLLQLAVNAAGYTRVDGSPWLLSGLLGVPTGHVRSALARLESQGLLKRLLDDEGYQRVELAYPPADPVNADPCAHVRGGGGA